MYSRFPYCCHKLKLVLEKKSKVHTKPWHVLDNAHLPMYRHMISPPTPTH